MSGYAEKYGDCFSLRKSKDQGPRSQWVACLVARGESTVHCKTRIAKCKLESKVGRDGPSRNGSAVHRRCAIQGENARDRWHHAGDFARLNDYCTIIHYTLRAVKGWNCATSEKFGNLGGVRSSVEALIGSCHLSFPTFLFPGSCHHSLPTFLCHEED